MLKFKLRITALLVSILFTIMYSFFTLYRVYIEELDEIKSLYSTLAFCIIKGERGEY